MPRKYINRSRKDPGEVTAEDEWAHITGDAPEIDEKDAMDVQDRSIILQKHQAPKKGVEKIKEEARNAMDAAGNTCQYIKYVNAHIDNQKKEIDNIKKIKEKFDEDVRLLQSHNPNLQKLDVNSLDNFDVNTVTNYLQQLLDEKGLTKKKLDNLKNHIVGVEDELQKQEQQIKGLNEELISKKQKEIDENDSDSVKNELNSLVEKYGVENIANIFDMVKNTKKSST